MGLMKPIWRRKIRRVGGELVISIPSELKSCFEGVEGVVLTIEGNKIVIFTEKQEVNTND